MAAFTDNNDAKVDVKNLSKDVSVSWYADSIGKQLTPQSRSLLEEYSHIPPNEVENHVYLIRSKGWQVYPYPCIGQFRFLDLSIALHPYYPTLLERLKIQKQTLLDLGCCFGQDIRALVAAGVPSTQLYGCDLRKEFFELGFELFLDQDTLQSTFLAGDVFADPTSAAGRELAKLDGKVDVVHIASFLHLFGWENQIKACERIVKVLKAKEGSVVIGRQIGGRVAKEIPHKSIARGKMWRHDGESFREMWKVVGEKTGTKWKVEVEVMELGTGGMAGSSPLHDEDTRRVTFTVLRE